MSSIKVFFYYLFCLFCRAGCRWEKCFGKRKQSRSCAYENVKREAAGVDGKRQISATGRVSGGAAGSPH